MRLAIILPVLNEADGITAALEALAPLRARGAQVIVVDGGSRDDTLTRAAAHADAAIVAAAGRARQMNAGARHPRTQDCDVLLFLHADTRLPPDADRLIFRSLANSDRGWGRFDVRIDGRHPLLPLAAWMMNGRSRLTGICTGDQAIFTARGTFIALGGFADLPLMEDIDFARRARLLSAPLALRARVVTSGRRWDAHGFWRTVLLMWGLRAAFALGVAPERLARWYRQAR
jgi:rSAM/selenodomain-associated transferase 2